MALNRSLGTNIQEKMVRYITEEIKSLEMSSWVGLVTFKAELIISEEDKINESVEIENRLLHEIHNLSFATPWATFY